MSYPFIVKDTMADMRNLSSNEITDLQNGVSKGVQLLGYYEKGDTPNPINYYLSSTTSTDDGGSVIAVGGVMLEHKFTGEINVVYFGIRPNDMNPTSVFLNIFTYAISKGLNIYHPAGVYSCNNSNFPYKNPSTSGLLDCKNITIYGDGANTILKTTSDNGADVLQLNAVKNLHIRSLSITAELNTSSSAAGSNGISITNGYDNLTIKDVFIINLPYVDKGTYLDGGKGLTIQPFTTANECGTLLADVIVKNCAYGLGADLVLETMATKKSSVKVNVIAEKCYRGVTISCPAAGSALDASLNLGYDISSHTINCQQDVVFGRVHGVKISNQITTTEDMSQLNRNPAGDHWNTTDILVLALDTQYVKNSEISIFGNKKACDYKARVGGAAPGNSTLNGSSSENNIRLDIGGNSAVNDILDVNFGGNVMLNTDFHITNRTATILPISFYLPSRSNNLFIGTLDKLTAPIISNKITFGFASNGYTETGNVQLIGNTTGLQGKGTSVNNSIIAGLFDSSGTLRLGIKNGNGIIVDSINSTASTGTAYKGRIAVYNNSNEFLGFIALYNVS